MVWAKITPVAVKKAQSFSVTSKKVTTPSAKTTRSAAKTSSPVSSSVSSSGGANISAGVNASLAVVKPSQPVLLKTPLMPNTPYMPYAPQSPISPYAPAGFGNMINNMSNLTTANTNISMSTGNYFGSGATIIGANFGNVNINVAPSVTSSGPSVFW